MRGLLEHLALGIGLVHLHESTDGVLDLCEEDHRGDDVGLVGGLLVQRNNVAVEHGVVNFALGAGQTGDVGGQASYKPYIIAAMIFLAQVKDPVKALMELDAADNKRKMF